MVASTESRDTSATSARTHLGRLAVFLVLVGLVPWLAFDGLRVSPIADYPLVVVLVIWGVFLFWRGVGKARRKQGGALAFNLGFVCIALAAAELWVGMSSGLAKHTTAAPSRTEYVSPHPDLGYVPNPDKAWHFAAESEGEPVYDVTYTIAPNGLRAGPPLRDPPPEGSVLCFGCSFTFGNGLEDDQAYPWRVEEALDGRLRSYNFGFTGYGPHQMLANLETGRAESLVEYPVRAVLYLAIPDHARRVTGDAVHDRRGPRYVLEEDGSVRRDGDFSGQKQNVIRKRIFQFMNHSHLGQAITRRLSRAEGSVELLTAVVAAAQDASRARWPDSRFHVLLWDDRGARSTAIFDALEARGIAVHRVSTMLPGFAENVQQYRLHAADEHPNAKATAALAAYVARSVLGPATD